MVGGDICNFYFSLTFLGLAIYKFLKEIYAALPIITILSYSAIFISMVIWMFTDRDVGYYYWGLFELVEEFPLVCYAFI